MRRSRRWLLTLLIGCVAVSPGLEKPVPAQQKINATTASTSRGNIRNRTNAKLVSPLPQLLKAVDGGEPLIAAVRKMAPQAVHGDKVQLLISVKAITPDLLDALKREKLDVQSSQSVSGINHVIIQATDLRVLSSIAQRDDVLQILFEPSATTNPPTPRNH